MAALDSAPVQPGVTSTQVQTQMQTQTQDAPGHVTWFLRGPFVFATLAAFTLRDFFRSPWLAVNVVGLLVEQLLLYGNPLGRPQFFTVAYGWTLAMAALNTAVMLSRANSLHTLPLLARPVSRTLFASAVMLGAWVISLAGYALTALLAMARYGPPFYAERPDWLSLGLFGSLGVPVVVGVTFVVTLMALMANFVAPFWVRLTTLVVLALGVTAFDPRSFPIEALAPWAEKMPPFLAPVAGAIRYSIDPVPDAMATASVIIVAAYTTTLLALVLWLTTRRDVDV